MARQGTAVVAPGAERSCFAAMDQMTRAGEERVLQREAMMGRATLQQALCGLWTARVVGVCAVRTIFSCEFVSNTTIRKKYEPADPRHYQ